MTLLTVSWQWKIIHEANDFGSTPAVRARLGLLGLPLEKRPFAVYQTQGLGVVGYNMVFLF